MKKVLVAVDDVKGSKSVLAMFNHLVRLPEEIILLHVERLEGSSLMIDMLGEAELSTLREELKDSEHKKKLDMKAGQVLEFCKAKLEENGLTGIRTMVTDGIPAEEILKVSMKENVDLIILGYGRKKGLNRFIAGSVARDVENNAKAPVLVSRRPAIWEEASIWMDAYYAVSFSTVVIVVMFFLGIIWEKVFLSIK